MTVHIPPDFSVSQLICQNVLNTNIRKLSIGKPLLERQLRTEVSVASTAFRTLAVYYIRLQPRTDSLHYIAKLCKNSNGSGPETADLRRLTILNLHQSPSQKCQTDFQSPGSQKRTASSAPVPTIGCHLSPKLTFLIQGGAALDLSLL